MFASILNVAANIGYPSVFLIVMAESAGIPLPGETALVTAGLLASQHKLQIPLVVGVAASAAVIGDNLGYLIGRKGGRWLLERPGPFARSRRRALDAGIPFFERHGKRAVFFGRWLIGLRTWAAWLAGATRMPWRAFAVWNALGGISWATTIGLVAYFAGAQGKSFIASFGIYGLLTSGLTFLTAVLWRRHTRHHSREEDPPGAPSTPTAIDASGLRRRAPELRRAQEQGQQSNPPRAHERKPTRSKPIRGRDGDNRQRFTGDDRNRHQPVAGSG